MDTNANVMNFTNSGSLFTGPSAGLRPLLARFPATAAYSLRDLGNKVGAVTNVGDTSETVIKPTCRLRRTSDDAHGAFTWPQIRDGVATSWANEDVVTYESDFSAGVDGWIGSSNCTVAAPTASPGGGADSLLVTLTAGVVIHNALRLIGYAVGQNISVSIEIYLPSSNSAVDGIRILDASAGISEEFRNLAQDQWVTLTTNGVAANTQMRLYPMSGTNQTFEGGGDTYYIRNIQVTQLTSSAALVTKYDQMGNGYHATQASAGAQPLVIENGVLVTAANPSVKFDGVDDDLDFAAAFTGLTNASIYAVIDNGGTVTLETLTGQDISAVTTMTGLLSSLTYDKVTAVLIYPDNSNEAAIQSSLTSTFGPF